MSIVRMMKEQGARFDWSQVVLDLILPDVFIPTSEWPNQDLPMGPKDDKAPALQDLLRPGYTVDPDTDFIIKVTGPDPKVKFDGSDKPVFMDCEGVIVAKPGFKLSNLTPVRTITPKLTEAEGFYSLDMESALGFTEDFYLYSSDQLVSKTTQPAEGSDQEPAKIDIDPD